MLRFFWCPQQISIICCGFIKPAANKCLLNEKKALFAAVLVKPQQISIKKKFV